MVKQTLSVFSAFEVYSSFSPKHLLHASVVNIMRAVRRWQWITARDDRIVTQDRRHLHHRFGLGFRTVTPLMIDLLFFDYFWFSFSSVLFAFQSYFRLNVSKGL